jgi:hypothetical protein
MARVRGRATHRIARPACYQRRRLHAGVGTRNPGRRIQAFTDPASCIQCLTIERYASFWPQDGQKMAPPAAVPQPGQNFGGAPAAAGGVSAVGVVP